MALSDVQTLITNASTRAETALDAAIDFGETAQTVAGSSITSLGTVPNPTEPDIVIPPFVTATEDLGNEFRTQYSNVLSALQSALDDELSDYMTAYFPSITSCFADFRDWICNQIENGGSGLNSVVEAALFQRARDRLSLDQSGEEDELTNGYAAAGWNIPSAMLADGINRSRQGVRSKIGEFNRDMTIQQFEAEKEMTRFAIEQFRTYYVEALKLRNELMDLFRRIYETATQNAAAYVDAKRRLWEGVAAYYRALIDAAGLTLEYDKIRIDSAIKQNEYFVEAYLGQLNARWNAAVGSAEAAGKVAAAYAGAQNALAEIAHITEATE